MLKDELIDKYGPTMTVTDLAEVLHVTKGTIHNYIHKKKFEIPVFKLGGRVVAETKDVADYINNAKILHSVNG